MEGRRQGEEAGRGKGQMVGRRDGRREWNVKVGEREGNSEREGGSGRGRD